MEGYNVLFWEDDVEQLKDLIDKKVISIDTLQDQSLLVGDAVLHNAKKCFKFLIDSGYNVNYICSVGNFALMTAVIMLNFECVDILIKAGAIIDLKRSRGPTPLEHCLIQIDYAYCRMTEVLLFAGADLSKVSRDVYIPPWVLCLRDKIEQHRSTTLSLYGGYLEGKTQKKVVPPKDIILIICKMMWNKRKI